MSQERLTMRKIKEILRLKHEAGLSNRAIAGACKVSNSTVGEYLRRAKAVGIEWPLDNIGEEELYEKLFPSRQAVIPERNYSMPDWEEVHNEKRRKGVTLQLLWQEYKEQYPEGYQYSQYCEHYRRWKHSQIEPSRHIEHTGGEQMQVDYAGLKIPITDPETGKISEASIFVAVLPASNYTYAEAQASADQCSWNNAHVRALAYFGGVVKIVVPDNLKTGVTKPNYYEPDINQAYQELAEYYHLAVLPARIRKPKDKAASENGVQNVERWVIAPLRKRQFFSLHELNLALAEQLEKLNTKVMSSVGRTRREEFEAIDKPNLRPLPQIPYEYATRKTATVHIDYHVEFEKHLYSVPYTLIHEKVDIRATERMVEIFHKGKSIATHPRSARMGRFSTLSEHMPANHQFMEKINAEKLKQWAGKVGPKTRKLVEATLQSRHFPEQAYRTCLGYLSLAKKVDHAILEQAAQVILEARVFSYKDLRQEVNYLLQKMEPETMESFPTHDNIRGAIYYQERTEV